MNHPLLSRRKMLLTSGILVTGLSQFGHSAEPAQDELDLIFRTDNPRNAEPDMDKLVQSWLTPTKHFYVRSHAANPDIDANAFRLKIEGLIDAPASLSMEDLKKFPEHTITATLTCAGNRRQEFNREAAVGGVQWQAGAIGNATWTGVALADVLKKASIQASAQHVWFEGLDEVDHEGGIIAFGASIPIEKAMAASQEIGALLVYAMNGAPLTPDHGFPLRTVVPGYIGARSVKWLGKIIVSDRPSPNHYLASAYKLVRGGDAIDWAEAGPIYRYPINAAAAPIAEGKKIKPGTIQVKGYVLPSGISGAEIQRVLVSTDGGENWTKAKLTGQNENYCWQLWEAEVDVTKQTQELIVRATDTEGGFMPARTPWNAKGYLQNSWYRQPLEVE